MRLGFVGSVRGVYIYTCPTAQNGSITGSLALLLFDQLITSCR